MPVAPGALVFLAAAFEKSTVAAVVEILSGCFVATVAVTAALA